MSALGWLGFAVVKEGAAVAVAICWEGAKRQAVATTSHPA